MTDKERSLKKEVLSKIKKAGALIFKENRLLIVKPHEKPFFINPGGKYEKGESAFDCLKRELQEKLQLELVSCREYKTYNFKKAAHSPYPLSLELYLVTITGIPKPSSEIEIMEWLSMDDFKNQKFNLAPSFSTYIPDLIKDGLLI